MTLPCSTSRAELQPAVSKALLAEQLYAATADPSRSGAGRSSLGRCSTRNPRLDAVKIESRLPVWQAAGRTLLRHGVMAQQPAELTLAVDAGRQAAEHAPAGSPEQLTSLGYRGIRTARSPRASQPTWRFGQRHRRLPESH